MSRETRLAELRHVREQLLVGLDAVADPGSLWSFQQRLVDEIIAVEPRAFADRRSPEREHLKLLRLFGDSLAWMFLHPHAIRQISKNAGPPPALHNQAGLAATLAIAQATCASGEPALVADLTFCLRVSDVIVCTDPERPRLIESGGHPSFAERGRKGRQKRRASAITKLLTDGEATLLDDQMVTTSIEIADKPTTSIVAVETAIDDLYRDGQGVVAWSTTDLVVAMHKDDESVLPPLAEKALAEMRAQKQAPGTLAIGVHLRLLERPNAHLPPPHVWPIPQAQRLALIEGDVVLIHLLDLDGFIGPDSTGLGRISEIGEEGAEIAGFVVEIAGGDIHVSPRFLDNVLYGFETIDSARDAIVAMAAAAAASFPEDLARPGSIARLDTIEEAEAVLQQQSEGKGPALATIPLSLLGTLRNRPEEPAPHSARGVTTSPAEAAKSKHLR